MPPVDAGILSWLVPAALILTRVSGLAWTAPGWGTPGLGWRIRLGLVILLTVTVLPLIGPEPFPSGLGAVRLAGSVLIEVVIGATLGLTLALVVAAAQQAGELIGLQAGLAPAALFDPETGGTLTPLGHLYGLLALGLFLIAGGPIQLVTTLLESYRALPPGVLTLDETQVVDGFSRIGWAFGLALRAAAPVLVALLGAGLLLGWISRAATGLSLASLALPARLLTGLGLALIGLTIVAGLFAETWSGLLP